MRTAWLAPAGLAMTLLIAACGTESGPEARLRATIESVEAAAEAGDRRDFLAHVAADFAGQGGRLDQSGLGEFFRVQLLAHTRIRAVLSQLQVQLHDRRATATFNALVTGGPRTWLPESGQLYRVETGWRLEEDRWLLISAEWRPLVGG